MTKCSSVLSFLLALIPLNSAMAQNGEVVHKKFKIKDIPVLVSYTENNLPKPLVILCHAGFGKKEDWSEQTRTELANEGYYVVVLDSRLHGEREGLTINTMVKEASGKIDMPELLKAVTGTAEDVSTLIDYFEKRSLVQPNNTSVIGISMGGLITFKALSKEKRIKAAVTIVSTNDWNIHPLGVEGIRKNVTDEHLKKADEYASEFNSRQAVANYAPCAIMMHNGMVDDVVDIDKIKQSQQEMAQYYQASPNKLKFFYYENMKHQFQEDEWKLMWQRTKEWLSVNIKNNKPESIDWLTVKAKDNESKSKNENKKFEVQKTISINSSKDSVFRLLCPRREYDWIPGWECEILKSKSGYNEQGCVFITQKVYGNIKMVWTTHEYDSDKGYIEFQNFAPGLFVMKYCIQVTSVDKEQSKIEFHQLFQSISAEGNKKLEEFNVESSSRGIARLETLMNDYFLKRRNKEFEE
jgi:uncharacterized protein